MLHRGGADRTSPVQCDTCCQIQAGKNTARHLAAWRAEDRDLIAIKREGARLRESDTKLGCCKLSEFIPARQMNSFLLSTILQWVLGALLAALLVYAAFRGYLSPEFLIGFANLFTC